MKYYLINEPDFSNDGVKQDIQEIDFNVTLERQYVILELNNEIIILIAKTFVLRYAEMFVKSFYDDIILALNKAHELEKYETKQKKRY